jgi:hypothetical protein
MAEFFPPVIFEVKAKATEAIAEFGKVNAELSKMEVKLTGSQLAMARFERAGKLAGTTLLGMAGAFGVVAASSIHALDGFEKSQTNLEVAVKNTGVSFAAAEPAIKSHAEEMRKLGFSYTDTYEALAKMTAASGSPQVALDALSAAADLARAKQISLADAGTIVARASVGMARGMADLGIALGKTLPKGASFQQILKAIQDRAGGAAKAFGDTLAGKLAVARANFQALEIQIGTQIAPAIGHLADWVSTKLLPTLSNLGNWFKNNMGLVTGFGLVLGGIWAVSKMIAFISMLTKIKDAFIALRTVLIGVAAIEAYATGGVSVVAATAAIAAAGAVYGGFKLADILGSKGGASATTPYSPLSGMQPDVSLAGKGPYKRYDSSKVPKVKKPSFASQMRGTVGSVNVFNINNPSPATINAIKNGRSHDH